ANAFCAALRASAKLIVGYWPRTVQTCLAVPACRRTTTKLMRPLSVTLAQKLGWIASHTVERLPAGAGINPFNVRAVMAIFLAATGISRSSRLTRANTRACLRAFALLSLT